MKVPDVMTLISSADAVRTKNSRHATSSAALLETCDRILMAVLSLALTEVTWLVIDVLAKHDSHAIDIAYTKFSNSIRLICRLHVRRPHRD